jgi:hypothetical protein
VYIRGRHPPRPPAAWVSPLKSSAGGISPARTKGIRGEEQRGQQPERSGKDQGCRVNAGPDRNRQRIACKLGGRKGDHRPDQQPYGDRPACKGQYLEQIDGRHQSAGRAHALHHGDAGNPALEVSAYPSHDPQAPDEKCGKPHEREVGFHAVEEIAYPRRDCGCRLRAPTGGGETLLEAADEGIGVGAGRQGEPVGVADEGSRSEQPRPLQLLDVDHGPGAEGEQLCRSVRLGANDRPDLEESFPDAHEIAGPKPMARQDSLLDQDPGDSAAAPQSLSKAHFRVEFDQPRQGIASVHGLDLDQERGAPVLGAGHGPHLRYPGKADRLLRDVPQNLRFELPVRQADLDVAPEQGPGILLESRADGRRKRPHPGHDGDAEDKAGEKDPEAAQAGTHLPPGKPHGQPQRDSLLHCATPPGLMSPSSMRTVLLQRPAMPGS